MSDNVTSRPQIFGLTQDELNQYSTGIKEAVQALAEFNMAENRVCISQSVYILMDLLKIMDDSSPKESKRR